MTAGGMRSEEGPSADLASVCGLFCGACSVYLATREDPARLARLAERLGQTVDETRCDGCRADRRARHCRICRLAACAAERGLAFCGACPDHPCPAFTAFQAACPHRAEIPSDLAAIQALGAAAWVAAVAERYRCPACGSLNAAYDLACRACGHEPGSPFAADHGEALRAFLTSQTHPSLTDRKGLS